MQRSKVSSLSGKTAVDDPGKDEGFGGLCYQSYTILLSYLYYLAQPPALDVTT